MFMRRGENTKYLVLALILEVGKQTPLLFSCTVSLSDVGGI